VQLDGLPMARRNPSRATDRSGMVGILTEFAPVAPYGKLASEKTLPKSDGQKSTGQIFR